MTKGRIFFEDFLDRVGFLINTDDFFKKSIGEMGLQGWKERIGFFARIDLFQRF